MKVGIVGLGHVGSAMLELFKDATVYDKYKKIGSIEEINKCDVAFICVPTPANDDGSCDVSIVDDILNRVNTDLIILRSTVPIFYTETKVKELNKKIVFQPEYYGETVDHPFAKLQDRKWLTLGGEEEAVNKAIEVYQTVYNSNIQIIQVKSREAELAKYMENSFLATKVIFCNEFYDIAEKLDINYNKVREAFAIDPRIGYSHTFVYKNNRGYKGSCLPKDISSIRYQAKQNNIDTTLLNAVVNKNKTYEEINEEHYK